ncbi:plasma kallikrein-like [Ixodes scapularis]|uniref:plasma kallikrein-like n=1 Tax=Ixodes scapularis TaxID=6945 RepID=UPI001C38C853|nr:plasma kallikrein-like [Ixodes scapularis]
MPICLPEKNQVFDNRTCTATGWGYLKDRYQGGRTLSNVLQKVNLPTVSYNECKNDYKDVSTVVEDTMICAGPKEGGKSACNGDSGGPLQCSWSDGRYVLAGCTSWGKRCAKRNQPTVFARVSTQLDWIASVAGATP